MTPIATANYSPKTAPSKDVGIGTKRRENPLSTIGEDPLEKRIRRVSREALLPSFPPSFSFSPQHSIEPFDDIDLFACSPAPSHAPRYSQSPSPLGFPFDCSLPSSPLSRSSPSPSPMFGVSSPPPSPISFETTPDLEEPDPFHTALGSIRKFGAFVDKKGNKFVIERCLGKGDFSIVNEFTGNVRFDQTYPNENLVISLFRENVSRKETATLEEFVTNARKQYDRLRALRDQFPLALPEILQWTDFQQNIPYTIKEKAERLKMRRWEPETPINELPADTIKILTPLKEAFAFGLKYDIAIDFSNWGNLMMLKGRLCLVDFFELRDKPGTFKSNIPKFLEALSTCESPSRKGHIARNFHIEQFLTPLEDSRQ